MNQIKRKLQANPSDNQKTKKLRSKFHIDQKTISIISIENLSNELLYEIFDYLEGCEIYQAFSNLNHRFQQLLDSSSFLFKIKIHHSTSKEIFMSNYKQIFSIHFETLYDISSIISSMDRLESITLEQIKADTLISLLNNLIYLPRLFILTVDVGDSSEELSDIYRLIFNLPKLRYLKFSASESKDSDVIVSLPVANSKEFSSIEYLILNHFCTIDKLSTIISYTPQLRRLGFGCVFDNDLNDGNISPITLPDLTHLSIHVSCGNFNELEMLISKTSSKLKILSVYVESVDTTYLNANRWKQIILQYLPQLKKFYFQYHQSIDYENESLIYFDKTNQFTSSFWIERKWVFKAEIDYENIIYSIQPYEKQWYEYDAQHKVAKSSTRLILTFFPSDACLDLFMIDLNQVLAVGQMYHLEIPRKKIFIGILIQIMNFLPKLTSLKIHSLSLNQPRNLYRKEADILCSSEDVIKITKVYLEELNEIAEVYFLMTLCPYMAYLKIDRINNLDAESFVQKILNKINFEQNKYLRLLCFGVPAADDEIVKKLEKMINSEKLLLEYTIKRVLDNIYLQWN